MKVWFHSYLGTPSVVVPVGYDERNNAGTTLLHKDLYWGSDSAGNAYMNESVTTMDPGQTYAAATTTAQTLDVYGNLLQQKVWDYGVNTSGTATRTYTFSYLAAQNGLSYVNAYIRNRLTSASVTDASANVTTLATVSYDQNVLLSQTGLPMHDDGAFGTGNTVRGNPTTSYRFGDGSGNSNTLTTYTMTGIAATVQKGSSGPSVSVATSSNSNYSLPSALTPHAGTTTYSNLASSFSYTSDFGVTSVTGPNNANQTVLYDGLNRPMQATSVDTGITNYAYSFAPNTQTATVYDTGQWVRTTLDGFGHTVRVENGNGGTTMATVDTLYAPCGCSPLGKMSQTSNPYGPGESPAWTYYAYDARGRTSSVTSADTSYVYWVYQGNWWGVSDPAKSYGTDAFGNTWIVGEPDPGGSNNPYYTNYTYNAMSQLTQVTMARTVGGVVVTQTRTFTWADTDLMSATDPETWTTSYQYSGSHLVTQRTDQKGQVTQYGYDPLNRLSQVFHGVMSGGYFQESVAQHVNYFYDSAPAGLGVSLSSNTQGRLTAVQFQNQDTANPMTFWEGFDYSIGELAKNWLVVYDPGNVQIAATSASYGKDHYGRLTSVTYPSDNLGTVGGMFGYGYDSYGRLATMTDPSSRTIYTATQFNAAGQVVQVLNNLSYATENRSYNNLMQLTGISGPGINVGYQYTAGSNHGRLSAMVDQGSGQDISYQYDALARLSSATDAKGAWSASYTYDGFSNLIGKTGMGGAPNQSLTVDPTTNRPPGYDVNGYPTAPGQYDTEGHQVTNGAGTWWVYDPWGRRIWQETQPSAQNPDVNCTFVFYSATGQRLTEFSGTYVPGSGMSYSVTKTYQYFGGRLIEQNGGTNPGAVAVDRLGSVRSGPDGAFASYPYGEEQGTTVNGQMKFGTYYRDLDGADYAMARRYVSGTGSFVTPGPAGNAAANKGDPRSWNRYLYSGGDPVNGRDRTGMAGEWPPGAQDCIDDPYQEGCNDPCQPLPSFELMAGRGLMRAEGMTACEEPVAPEPTPAKVYRTYFLEVQQGSDCYRVPTNGGAVTRDITYLLFYTSGDMPAPSFTNTGVIWEHLAGGLRATTGRNSASTGPPGTFEDQQSIAGVGTSNQLGVQTFSAVLQSGVSFGLAIAAFGGTVQYPVASLNIQKYAGYVSINGNTGGTVANGRLVPGTYVPCN